MTNLFNENDLLPIFKQTLGLTEQTPFECIGEVDETRLTMKKCLEKGLQGKALDLFKQEILANSSINWEKLEQKYAQVYATEHAISDWIFKQIREQF